jgi:hypothetical protein
MVQKRNPEQLRDFAQAFGEDEVLRTGNDVP